MKYHTQAGEGLKGDRIVGTARKLTKPEVVIFSGRHRAMRIKLIENAYCVIEKELRFLG